MEKIKVKVNTKQILADIITPVGIYLKIRDIFPKSLLLEGADHRGGKNSYSFICINPIATFIAEKRDINISIPGGKEYNTKIENVQTVPRELEKFLQLFQLTENPDKTVINGIFGYTGYDAIRYFEDIQFQEPKNPDEKIPEMMYSFYNYIIAIDHFKNTLTIIENLIDGGISKINEIETLLQSRNYAMFNFITRGVEKSNLGDEGYMHMVTKGKEHCYRGDV